MVIMVNMTMTEIYLVLPNINNKKGTPLSVLLICLNFKGRQSLMCGVWKYKFIHEKCSLKLVVFRSN